MYFYLDGLASIRHSSFRKHCVNAILLFAFFIEEFVFIPEGLFHLVGIFCDGSVLTICCIYPLLLILKKFS